MTRKVLAGLPRLVVAQLIFCCAIAAHAGVTSELQRAIREGTFEVVMKKPQSDPVSYEKPLPLDLLPYIVRWAPPSRWGTTPTSRLLM